MIIYNITVKVETTIQNEWFTYFRDTIVPEMLATNYFTSVRISKLLSQQDDDGITYSIQCSSPSMKHFHTYQINFAPKLQEKHRAKFGEKALTYRTMMEVVEEFNA